MRDPKGRLFLPETQFQKIWIRSVCGKIQYCSAYGISLVFCIFLFWNSQGKRVYGNISTIPLIISAGEKIYFPVKDFTPSTRITIQFLFFHLSKFGNFGYKFLKKYVVSLWINLEYTITSYHKRFFTKSTFSVITLMYAQLFFFAFSRKFCQFSSIKKIHPVTFVILFGTTGVCLFLSQCIKKTKAHQGNSKISNEP